MYHPTRFKTFVATFLISTTLSSFGLVPAIAQTTDNSSPRPMMKMNKTMTPEQMRQHHQNMMGQMQQMMGQMQQHMAQMTPEEMRQHHQQMMGNHQNMMQQMKQMMQQMKQHIGDTDRIKKDSDIQTGHQMNKAAPE